MDNDKLKKISPEELAEQLKEAKIDHTTKLPPDLQHLIPPPPEEPNQ